jgi:hypothetical protein
LTLRQIVAFTGEKSNGSGREAPRAHFEIVMKAGEASFYAPLTAPAEQELGLRSTLSLDDSIRRMFPAARLK